MSYISTSTTCPLYIMIISSTHLMSLAPLAPNGHALHGHGLRQILRALRLPCARRALGAAAIVEVEGAHQGAVAAVREGRDHQALAVAQVLEAVVERGVDDGDLNEEKDT